MEILDNTKNVENDWLFPLIIWRPLKSTDASQIYASVLTM